MSDVEVESKKKAPNGPKAKPPAHPPTSEMVTAAIKILNERQGSSLRAIKKYIGLHYEVDPEKINGFIKRFLKRAVESGSVVQTTGKGASGSFKLPSAAKKANGNATETKVTKAVKKPTAEKVTKARAPEKPTAEKIKTTPKKTTKAFEAKAKKLVGQKNTVAVAEIETPVTEGKITGKTVKRRISFKTKRTTKVPTTKPKTPRPKRTKKAVSTKAAKKSVSTKKK